MTPFIAAHAAGAALALTLGALQVCRRTKGDHAHRWVGRAWVVLMYWVVLSSFGIRELDPGHLSWIHGLSAFTFVTLTLGLVFAVRGDIRQHRGFMTGSYLGLVGAFVGAVAVPQRDIPTFAVDDPLGFGTAVAVLLGATAAVYAWCRRSEARGRAAQSARAAAAEV